MIVSYYLSIFLLLVHRIVERGIWRLLCFRDELSELIIGGNSGGCGSKRVGGECFLWFLYCILVMVSIFS